MAKNSWASGTYLFKSSNLGITAPPLTLACFYQPNTFSADAIMVCVTSTSDNNMFDLQVFSATKQVNAEAGQAGAWSSANDGQAVMTTGVWYHCAAVFTSSTSRTAYRNGTAGTVDTTSKVPASIVECFIGKSSGGNATHGIIAVPCIYNIDLSAKDIAALASGRHPRWVRPQNLVACLNLTGNLSSDPDLVTANTWSITGTPTDEVNPRIYM